MSRFRKGRHGLVVAIAAVVALGLTGCGQSEPTAANAKSEKREASADKSTTTVAELTPTAMLTKAAKATAEHDSYRMRMIMTADGMPGMDMTTLTSADGKTQKSTIKSGEIGEMTMLLIDGAFYYQFPGLPDGKEWVKMDSADAMSELGIDPSAMAEQNSNALAMLDNLSDDVKIVGEEEIEGMKTVHYRYSFDVGAMMQGALDSGALEGDAAEAAEMFGGESDMDVWVGEDGLIRRVAYELKMGEGAPGMPGSISYEMTFSDFGAPLDVTAPDPSKTIAMSELMTLGS
ncbi:MAG TPA: LppX_LprAFG lipoprotein [Microthrixaceae bacterium]|nr:LppX_LprAFG lipoprotein [Microthrixaceae bacterium]